jgi:glycerophosphoryl diester phosphodiesterase
VAEGADMVELDVGRGLAVGHSRQERTGRALVLADVLDALAGLDVDIQLDLKCNGIESQVVNAVNARGLADRVLVSSNAMHSLRRFAELEPRIARGLGYPRDRVGAGSWPWPDRVADLAVAFARRLMTRRAELMLRFSSADVLMIHHALVTAEAVEVTHRLGVAFFTWTVNEPAQVAGLAALDVDGITTDDPKMALEALATLHSQ